MECENTIDNMYLQLAGIQKHIYLQFVGIRKISIHYQSTIAWNSKQGVQDLSTSSLNLKLSMPYLFTMSWNSQHSMQDIPTSD